MTNEQTLLQVRHLLNRKGREVFAVAPDATVYEALKRMAAEDIGALLVVENNRLVGIFSERDYARKVILYGKTSHETRVSEIMTEKVYYVTPDDSLEACMALMTDRHIRHLPVIDNGRLAGVISIGDVVKELIDEQGFVISQLENYITGGGR